jgi:hypothetical protein
VHFNEHYLLKLLKNQAMVHYNTLKEKEFYSKPFKFSYSSLNKLIFSPSLFYKDYILGDKEERLDKHLIEGKLIHCLVFEPEKLETKFKIIPGKVPTDNVRKIMHKLAERSLVNDKSNIDLMSKELEETILDILKEENLYQSLKEDSARVIKIQCEENLEYWNFINNPKVDVIDQETLLRCQEQSNIILQNENVKILFAKKETDFALDPIQTFSEKYLDCELNELPFGLKGYIDFYQIDDDNKVVTICDLKTTGKALVDFPETINFYNYWLQAAIYSKLVYENLSEEKKDYDILFKFIVIDRYNQVYPFDVSQSTLAIWADNFRNTINKASYHYKNNNYSLPYDFLTEKIIL